MDEKELLKKAFEYGNVPSLITYCFTEPCPMKNKCIHYLSALYKNEKTDRGDAIFTTRSGAKYLQFPFFRAFGKMASPLSVFSFLQRPDRQWIHLSFIGHGSVKQQVTLQGMFPYLKACFKSSFSSIQVVSLMKNFYINDKIGYLLPENDVFFCCFSVFYD